MGIEGVAQGGGGLLKPVIEALSDGHTVIYATEPLEMKEPLCPRGTGAVLDWARSGQRSSRCSHA